MILMDTDVCVEILRGNQHVLEERRRSDESVAISFMTVGELYYGAERSRNRIKNNSIVDEFIVSLNVIHTDFQILKRFGELKSRLQNKEIHLPDADILIATTAMAKGSKLITGNTKHFMRFENLLIENWLR